MSYILDALKKADAQRERDPARGIHAQAQPGTMLSPAERGAYRPWIWAAGAVGVAALASAGWYLLPDRKAVKELPPSRTALSAQAPAAPVVVVPAPAPVVGTAVLPPPAPAPVVATAIEPPVPRPAPMPPPRDPRATSLPTMRGPYAGQPVPPAAAPAIVAQLPAATPTAPTMPGTVSPQTGLPSAPPVMNPVAPAMPVNPPPPPMPVNPPPPPPVPPPVLPPAPPTPPAAGLPADAPKVAISGGVYSTNPAQRMLIVNGQVFNEGSELAPGVVLEEIRSKGSAVLRFRGSRYTVRY